MSDFNVLKFIADNAGLSMPEALEKAYLEGQESVKPKWISVSEKLPNIEVLCCSRYQDIMIGYVYADNESDTGYSAESEGGILMNMTAWMPLPEPYKENIDA